MWAKSLLHTPRCITADIEGAKDELANLRFVFSKGFDVPIGGPLQPSKLLSTSPELVVLQIGAAKQWGTKLFFFRPPIYGPAGDISGLTMC